MGNMNQKIGVQNSGVYPLAENVLCEVLPSNIFWRKWKSAITLQVTKYCSGPKMDLKRKPVFWHRVIIDWVVHECTLCSWAPQTVEGQQELNLTGRNMKKCCNWIKYIRCKSALTYG